MSSTEPPSRLPPRDGSHDTKSARDELSSKGKVEKVREVDPDEETRKKKFLKYYRDEGAEDSEQTSRPSPFDLYAEGQTPKAKSPSPFDQSKNNQFNDLEDAAIPSPPSTPPPSVASSTEEDSNDSSSQDLPGSSDFWEDVSLPDDPTTSQMQESAPSSQKSFAPNETDSNKNTVQSQHEGNKKKQDLTAAPDIKKKTPQDLIDQETAGAKLTPKQKKLEHEKLLKEKKRKKLEEQEQKKLGKEKREETQGQFHPQVKTKEFDREHLPKDRAKKDKHKAKKDQIEEIDAAPLPARREEESFAGFDNKKQQNGPNEIESLTAPPLPTQVQPMAQQATQQAMHYLHPNTASLFYQMVGTIYVMQNSGVNRTEIVLNNPSFSGSKFFGSTITIEKYATAPDSFNIKLSGSNEAVNTFKENIPSLMTAFQNSNLQFRVNRLDVEYSTERPVFKRKEREARGGGGGGSDAGSGDSDNRKRR